MVRFNALTLAADCCFFAADASTIKSEVRGLRLAALSFASAAATLAAWLRRSRRLLELHRFASLVVGLYDVVRDTRWTENEEEQVRPGLRAVARGAEMIVPLEYRFSNDDKTDYKTRRLADLSQDHGDPRNAQERLCSLRLFRKSDRWLEE